MDKVVLSVLTPLLLFFATGVAKPLFSAGAANLDGLLRPLVRLSANLEAMANK